VERFVMNQTEFPIARRLALNLCDRWWILFLRGVAAIAFGVLCFAVPGVVLTSLVLLFAAYAVVDGVFGVSLAILGRKEIEDWWVLLLWGLLGIGVGILTFTNPAMTGLILVFYNAAWAIASGVLEVALAIRLRKEIEGEWLLILAGVLSIAFGVALMARPGDGAVALVWLIGGYANAFGAVLAALALRVRSPEG